MASTPASDDQLPSEVGELRKHGPNLLDELGQLGPSDAQLGPSDASIPFDESDDESEEDHDEGDEDLDPYEDVEEEGDLGDLETLADELFSVWYGGSETRWAAYMWSILEKAGLTDYDDGDEASRTLVVSRLVALAGLSREFAGRAWGAGFSGEWREAISAVDFVGDYPLLDAVSVGRAAERQGVWLEDTYDARESVAGLVGALADNEWATVVKALLAELGESFLFASLWMTRDGDARYPLPGEVIGQIVNNPDWEMLDPFGWVQSGCGWGA